MSPAFAPAASRRPHALVAYLTSLALLSGAAAQDGQVPPPAPPIPAVPTPAVPTPAVPTPAVPTPAVPVPAVPVPGAPAPATQAPATQAPAIQGPAPEIYSPEPSVDLGEIMQGESRKHIFIVGNRGTADLLIHRVNPTCGCTVAHVKTPDGQLHDPKTQVEGTTLCTLKPGEQAEIQFEFNSTGQPTHKIEKTIVVISSDNKNPAMQLSFRIDVQKVISVEPSPLQLGEVTRGAATKARVYVKLLKIEDLTITGFLDKPEYLEATWEKATAPDGLPAIAIDVTLSDKAPTGYITAELKAQTNHPKLAIIPIQVYAQVRSEVNFDTGNAISKERLDFGVLTSGQANSKEVVVKNGNPAVPYVLKTVDVDSQYKDFFKVEVETIESGLHYKVKVTALDTLTARFFRGTLRFNADHPDLKMKPIDFHGWVKKPGP